MRCRAFEIGFLKIKRNIELESFMNYGAWQHNGKVWGF
jgi:hypothetical protein